MFYETHLEVSRVMYWALVEGKCITCVKVFFGLIFRRDVRLTSSHKMNIIRSSTARP